MDRKFPFVLDTREKKILGVCSGIGRAVNVDPTFIRIAWVAVPLLTFVTVWQAIVAYLICGVIGAVGRKRMERRQGFSEFERMEQSGRGRHSIQELRTKLDENDRRMMAIDHHLNSQNDELAREIEALRKTKEEETK
jgi:phage shock protein C